MKSVSQSNQTLTETVLFVTHKMPLKNTGTFDVLQTELTNVQHWQSTNTSQH